MRSSAMTMPRSLCELLMTAQATLSMYFWQPNEGLAHLDLLPGLDAICQRKAFGRNHEDGEAMLKPAHLLTFF